MALNSRVLPADLIAPYTGKTFTTEGPSIDRALQIYLPDIYPIPGASEFNILVTKATSAVETNTDIGITLDVPPNNIGIIRSLTLSISDMLTTTVVTWTVNVNGGPAPGYFNLSMYPRVSPFVSNAFDSFIHIPQGGKVRVVFTNTDGGSYTVGASIGGWFWPEALGKQWVAKAGAIGL